MVLSACDGQTGLVNEPVTGDFAQTETAPAQDAAATDAQATGLPGLDGAGIEANVAVRESRFDLADNLAGSSLYRKSDGLVVDSEEGLVCLHTTDNPVCWVV
ncbi:hypothetical protein JW859_05555 [bacterium]|nr:hypothetical protein [bacterium]